MAEDIVKQLEWLHSEFYDVDSVTSIVELAKAEIERLRTEFSAVLGDAIAKDAENERLRAAGDALQVLLRGRTAEFLAEIERLRSEQYIDGLGVDWCVLHHGVRNEDSNHCDAFNWDDGDHMLDEDGEYLPCDFRPLAYREAPRG